MELSAAAIVMKFKGLTALDGVSAALRKGEIVGLIGPNGSGKTTLLNVISGVFAPSAGAIGLGGQSWPRLSLTAAARLGIRRTFQNIRLFPSFTVLETVEVAAACAAHPHRVSRCKGVLQVDREIARRIVRQGRDTERAADRGRPRVARPANPGCARTDRGSR